MKTKTMKTKTMKTKTMKTKTIKMTFPTFLLIFCISTSLFSQTPTNITGLNITATENITATGNLFVQGSSLSLGQKSGKDIGVRTSQRALFHHTKDRLVINYRGDFEGGVRVQGPQTSFDGVVSIGTSAKIGSHALGVDGSICAREVKVQPTGWADFVFENDYNLPSLTEVENHINTNGHLKDIPSTKEVVENGFNVGEMDAKLLRKIEELTLYMIQQQKQIEALNSKLEALEDK